MGGSGANPLPRDLSVLTPQEGKVYLFAVDTWNGGVYPTERMVADFLGHRGTWWAGELIRSVRRKVGLPYLALGRPGGTHGLTPGQRRVLTMAWDLWDREPREEPTLMTLKRVFGHRGSSAQFVSTRRICLRKGLWPCKVRAPAPTLTAEEREFMVDLKRSGHSYTGIPHAFRERFGRRLSQRTLYRVLSSAGVLRRYRPRLRESLEDRKASVIEARGGFAPAKLEDPAAYRRALRRARSRPSSSSRQVPSP